jgi:tetratricopeptide (TPR) repeat protein
MQKTENRNLPVEAKAEAELKTEFRFGWLSLCACALLLVSFDRNATSSENTADEFGPVSLFSIDSMQNDNDDDLIPLDLQIPRNINLLNPYVPQMIKSSSKTFASAVKMEPSQNVSRPAEATPERLKQQLAKSRISPPDKPREAREAREAGSDSKADELRQLIEQIRSIEVEPHSGEHVEPQQQVQQPVNTPPVAAPEPPAVATAVEPSTFSTEATPKSISDQTLQKVDDLLKDPNHITNPFELAEILFRSGKTGPAGLCYKKALVSIDANDPNLADERAWILFQIGNCLKDNDPNTARESYAELIRTQPDSPWTEIARVRLGLLDWYQTDKPGEIIQQIKKPNP